MSAGTPPADPSLTRVRTADGRIAVAAWGDSATPPIVLVHGMRDHARNWDWTAAALADRFRCLAPDLRGHGDSDHAGSYTIGDYVGDLAAVVDALADGPVALVCHSFGATVGLHYAAAFPERVASLCAIECRSLSMPLMPSDAGKSYPELLRDWIAKGRRVDRRSPRIYASFEEALARVAEQHATLDTATIQHLTRHALIAGPDGELRWKYHNAVRLRPPEDPHGAAMVDALAAVACPVLLVRGADSWLAPPPEERLRLLRRHRLVTLAGAGHWLHHQRRGAFLSLLDEHLSNDRDNIHA